VAALTGPILQVPSSVSAIKVDGRRAYDLVRAGEQVALAARPVTITRFEIVEIRRTVDHLDVDAVVECTTGTYVRSLARDLGTALGVGGHLTALRRTTVGPFGLASAVDVYSPAGVPERGQRVEVTPAFAAEVAAAIIPAAAAVRLAFESRTVDDEMAGNMRYGRPVPGVGIPGVYGLFGPSGLLALVEESAGMARPRLVWDPAG
jgi:tRNA pseudouridine55 synthase